MPINMFSIVKNHWEPSFTDNPRTSLLDCWLTLLKAASRIRARVRSCGICGGQIRNGAGFLRALRFPLPIIPSSSIIPGRYNRPVVAHVPSGLSRFLRNNEKSLLTNEYPPCPPSWEPHTSSSIFIDSPNISLPSLPYSIQATSPVHRNFVYLIKKNSVARVHERTIPTERQQLVGEVSANFCG
jgi:hypothetical protein